MDYANTRNFWYMWDMVQRGYVNDCTDQWVKQSFSPALMLAICWEETEFQNIRQTGCSHEMWMMRWTRPGEKSDDGQVAGNHAVGCVQVERDTIGLWLLFNPGICLGLPDFTPDLIYAQNDKLVTTERKQKRARWWQTIDQKILANDTAGFQLGWRTFAHMHRAKPNTSAQTTLENYAGDSSARTRTKAQIVKGWLDTDCCLRAVFAMTPYRQPKPNAYQAQAENGFELANRMLAGAFFFAKPNGNFTRAFPGSNDAEVKKLSAIYGKFLAGGSYDQLLDDQARVATLRNDLKTALGIIEDTIPAAA
jgi:hypothetical protein